MRVTMGILRSKFGTYYVRKKVPKKLERAVAQFLGNGKERQTFLKESLKTKELNEAKRRAPAVLLKFDALMARASSRVTEQPRRELSQAEIGQMADYYFATLLRRDEEVRQNGWDAEALQAVLIARGIPTEKLDKYMLSDPPGTRPQFGISETELTKYAKNVKWLLPRIEGALARGDITEIERDLDEVSLAFGVHVDAGSAAYRQLGMALLRSAARACRVKDERNEGKWSDTPPMPRLPAPTVIASEKGDTLRAAFLGWQKDRGPAPGTIAEYERAIALFIQLHGDLPVSAITRTHARTFREALQDVPRVRKGKQLKQSLPELAQWGREHPEAPRLSAGTINKHIGGVQAISMWARDHGMIPDESAWHDPFARMRLEEDDPDRESFTMEELQTLFGSAVFTRGERPKGGQGEAAFWLPLLGLFTGARRGELAALTVDDVGTVETTKNIGLTFVADKKRGKRLKTKSSARIVPLHPELTRLGFTELVAKARREHSASAWLFPGISPESKGGAKSWSKWFGRYLAEIGIKKDGAKVFHSFRHTFKDALRQAGVGEDLNDALTGHSGGGRVGRGYGAKNVLWRFGAKTLVNAVSKVKYKGLNLSNISRDTHGGQRKQIHTSRLQSDDR